MPRPLNGQRLFIQFLATWLFLTTSAVTLVTWGNPKMRAVLGMGWGLNPADRWKG